MKAAQDVKPEEGEEFVPQVNIPSTEATPQRETPAEEREPRTPRKTLPKATKGQEKGRTLRTRSATQGKKNPRKRPRIESDEDEEQTTHPEPAPIPTPTVEPVPSTSTERGSKKGPRGGKSIKDLAAQVAAERRDNKRGQEETSIHRPSIPWKRGATGCH